MSSVPPVYNGERNETVSFTCLDEGGPGNTFTWTKILDDEILVNSSFLEVNISGAVDGGLYECGVFNRAGSGSVQAVLNGMPQYKGRRGYKDQSIPSIIFTTSKEFNE